MLLHEKARTKHLKHYNVWYMADEWRSNGYAVQFLFGTKRFVPADHCFVHVDLSVVSDEYLEFASRYPIVINGEIRDIRKTTIFKHILSKDPRYQGPVMVKSALNSAGWPERMIESGSGSLLVQKFIRRLGIPRDYILEKKDYEVFDDISAVPGEYFDDPRIIVEKFPPEIREGLYCVNLYQFLGDVHFFQKLWSTSPV